MLLVLGIALFEFLLDDACKLVLLLIYFGTLNASLHGPVALRLLKWFLKAVSIFILLSIFLQVPRRFLHLTAQHLHVLLPQTVLLVKSLVLLIYLNVIILVILFLFIIVKRSFLEILCFWRSVFFVIFTAIYKLMIDSIVKLTVIVDFILSILITASCSKLDD